MGLLERQKEFTGWLEKGFDELGLKGLPLVSACAVTGNASQENLVRPVTTGPKDHGSDGVLQWRLDRLDGPRGLKGWAQVIEWDWATLRTQAAFTLWELENDARYASLLRDLRAGTKRIETLVANFCWIYERPSVEAAALDTRISHAKSVYLILTRERGVGAGTKAGGAAVGGGLVVAGGANTAAGGDEWASAASVLAGLMSAVGPWLWEWFKQRGAKAQQAEMASEPGDGTPVEPLEVVVSQTPALDAAVADARALRSQLDKALERVADELQKARERSDSFNAAIASAKAEANLIRALTLPVLAEPGEQTKPGKLVAKPTEGQPK